MFCESGKLVIADNYGIGELYVNMQKRLCKLHNLLIFLGIEIKPINVLRIGRNDEP